MLRVELITPTQTVTRAEVESVSAPTPQGEISILPHHTPLVSLIGTGELRLRQGEATHSFAVSGGLLVVHDGATVRILADVAERAEEISEAAAEEAVRRALELRTRVVADAVAFASATAALERELARLRIARKARSRSRRAMAHDTASTAP